MLQIKQSTAVVHIVFLMVDSTDHVTGKTGLSPTVTISKNAGSFASPSGAITEIAHGWYKLAANATDTNTLGALALHATGTGADPTDMICANIVLYDPQAVLSTLDAAGVRSAVGLASANLDTQIGTLATASNLATVAGYLDTEIAAILADTNELQTDWADGGRLDLILDARASQTSVDDLPTNAELATSQAAADDATLAAIAALTIPSAATIADAVWDEAAAGHVAAGSTGEALGAAGAAGDPWITTLPGAYTAGQAGHTIGSLTFTVAGAVDANIKNVNDVSVSGTGAAGNEWGP